MLTIGTTVLGVNDVARATAFWCDALGYVPREEGDETWVVLVPQKGDGARLALMLSETAVQPHPRLHLDLYADDQAADEKLLHGGHLIPEVTGVDVSQGGQGDQGDIFFSLISSISL